MATTTVQNDGSTLVDSVTDVSFLHVWTDATGPKRLMSLSVTQSEAAVPAYALLFAKNAVLDQGVPLQSWSVTFASPLSLDFGDGGRAVLEKAGSLLNQGCTVVLSSTRNTYTAFGSDIFRITAEYMEAAEPLLSDNTVVGNTLYVSKAGADGDGTALFLTLAAAKAAAVDGDTIVVYPGTYIENDLLKDGVNWFLHPGVLITYEMLDATSSVRGIFDDHAGACECVIDGAGDLYFSTGIYDANPSNNTAGTAGVTGCISIANVNSSVNIRLNKLTHESFNNAAALYFNNGTESHVHINEVLNRNAAGGYSRTLDVDEIYWEDTGGPTWPFPDLSMGVFWGIGELYLDINHLDFFKSYSVWCSEPVGANTANMYYKGNTLNGKIYQSGHSLTYVSWFDLAYQNAMTADIANTFYGGKVYYKSQKTGSTAVNSTNIIFDCGAASGAQAEIWIDVQKVSGHKKFVRTAGVDTTAKVFLSIKHYEDLSVVVTGIEIGAFSDVVINPGYMKILNGNGVSFTGGTADIKGLTVNTINTNGASNHPVKVSANGLKLSNCQLIGPALADSINSTTAKNVTCMSTFTNKAKNANVTVIVGTLTVDAALV